MKKKSIYRIKSNSLLTAFYGLVFVVFCHTNIQAQTTQTLTTASSGTFAVPTGVTTLTVQCWGAGGGGGYAITTNGAAGGGGGGGAYTYSVITVTGGANINYTVGVGGAGGTTGGTAAKNGTASTFSTTSTVNANGGGLGGSSNSATPGTNGTGGLGGTWSGGNGATGINGTAGGGGGGSAGTSTVGVSASGATGGTAVTGGGAGGNGVQAGQNDGNTPGGGGSGGERKNNGSGSQAGGNGAAGQIIITYCLPITITTQPASVSGLCSGSNAAFTVVASGDASPGLTYQWQRDPNTGTFANITSAGMDAGVTYSTYTTSTLNLTGATSSIANYKYRCVVSEASPCTQSANTDGTATITFASAGSLSGAYTIGGSGTPSYATLTAAFADITCRGLSGNISLVLQSGYSSASETFPLTPSTNTGTYSVTVYPAATGLSITSSNATGTLLMDGCDNYIFDGRVNATGSTKDLTISNTNSAGYAIELIDDATYNTIKYCKIIGQANSNFNGVVFFSTGTSTGNDNNTIDNCDINASGVCALGISSTGSSSPADNSNNVISNCSVFDFFSTVYADLLGIYISTGNTDWTISGNSFYQTSARASLGQDMFGIYIYNTSGNNFVVSGNYIGGSAANCGGSALSFDASSAQNSLFYGISVTSGTTGACTVQSNTVTNISFGSSPSTSSTTYDFIGIAVSAGYIVVNSNIVGSSTGTGSISIAYNTGSSKGFVAAGIFSTATSGSVDNNIVGSITVTGGKTSNTGVINGMDIHGALGADFSISNNNIGSTATANSIQYATSSSAQVTMAGIWAGTTGSYNCNIETNTIENMTNNSTSAVAVTNGIYLWSGGSSYNNVSYNTIASLKTTAPLTSGLFGINMTNITASQTISGNIIHDLSNTYSGGTATDVNGIYFAGPTTGSSAISQNAVYNLTLASTATTSAIYGINIASGLATTSNNMITLGNGVTVGYAINGIYQNSTTSANNHYFNSVYIGGAAAAAGSNTNAFFSKTATHTIENNIFYNNRTQTAGAGFHFAIDVQTKAGVTSDYNDLLSSVAANLGSVNAGTATLTLANWESSAPAGDSHSINSNPSFVAPTATTANLHINSGSPVIGVGLNGAGSITVDFDNNARNNPPSMGADEEHTNYYSKSSGYLDALATWGTMTNGTGTSPTSFTATQCTYNIQNNASPTLGAAWTVSGTGSNIVLGDGTNACNFTIPSSYSCTGSMNISNNATLTIQNASTPTLATLNAGSTVNYNGANGVSQTVQAGTYGNLIISNSTGSGTSTKTAATGTVYIAGNLTISSYATFDIGANYANRTGGGGTLSVAANGTLRLSGTSGGASTGSNFPNNFATMTLNSSSTVEYYGTSAQTIYATPTYGNLTLTNNSTKTAGAGLTIDGSITINSTATFAGSTYTHYVGGNFINNGTFSSTGTIDFNGSSVQTFSGTTTTFNNFTLNNSSGLTLSAPVIIGGALKLTLGLLTTTATNSLVCNTSASISNALSSSATSYVNGPMTWQKNTKASQTLSFPIGTSGDCRPVSITVTHTTTTPYNYTAQLFNANGDVMAALPTYTNLPVTGTVVTTGTLSGVHYYDIERTTSAGAAASSTDLGSATATIYFGADDDVYDGSLLTVCKTYTNTTDWIDLGGTCSTSGQYTVGQVGTITTGTFSSFSYFVLGTSTGSSGNNPLPIELLYFTASPVNNAVDLTWATATETNNQYFTIERSKDGITFDALQKINSEAPRGNSTSTLNYRTYDLKPLEGMSYYRLKQTDYNGKYKYSAMQQVSFTGNSFVSIYPNPTSNTVFISASVDYDNAVVRFLDPLGREVISQAITSSTVNSINTGSLNPGVYTVITDNGNGGLHKAKLIIQK